jgi:8-oxo-dGTP pyrophosphatase MutT (NUDIX family)
MLTKSDLNKYTEYLRNKLRNQLPATEAHKQMSPVVGEDFFRTFRPSRSAKKSAVLLPVFLDSSDCLKIIFTLRSKNLGNHRGQISFPGGHAEPGESPFETALREANEEIGLELQSVTIAGKMSTLYVPPSDAIITPIVGLMESEPETVLNPDEVEEAFSLPLNIFRGSLHLKREVWDFSGAKVEVPFWDVHRRTPLWGATAMILKEFLIVSEDFLKDNS